MLAGSGSSTHPALLGSIDREGRTGDYLEHTEQFVDKKAQEIHSFANKNDRHIFYNVVKTIYGPTNCCISPVKTTHWLIVLSNQNSILMQWVEHDTLLNQVWCRPHHSRWTAWTSFHSQTLPAPNFPGGSICCSIYLYPLIQVPCYLDMQIMNNNRVISKLPFMLKLLEKAVVDQLTAYLSDNNNFWQISICRLTPPIHRNYLDQRNQWSTNWHWFWYDASVASWIECSFWHHRPLHIGIHGTVFSLFHFYVSNKTQCVRYFNPISEFLKVKFGIPQELVLAPYAYGTWLNLPVMQLLSHFLISFPKLFPMVALF